MDILTLSAVYPLPCTVCTEPTVAGASVWAAAGLWSEQHSVASPASLAICHTYLAITCHKQSVEIASHLLIAVDCDRQMPWPLLTINNQ